MKKTTIFVLFLFCILFLCNVAVADSVKQDDLINCGDYNIEKSDIVCDKDSNFVTDFYGAVVRMNLQCKRVYFVFTGDSLFEGIDHVRATLKEEKVPGSFFLTGNCIRLHRNIVKKLLSDGFYIGPHSDKHLLCVAWEDRNKTLVSADSLKQDIKANMNELKRAGAVLNKIKWFIPSYEYYNRDVVSQAGTQALQTLSFTPGTGTNADYTIPSMKNYRSSQKILDDLMKFEKENQYGLNGAILLIHPGTHPDRVDKLYKRLSELIDILKSKGYTFGSFSENDF